MDGQLSVGVRHADERSERPADARECGSENRRSPFTQHHSERQRCTICSVDGSPRVVSDISRVLDPIPAWIPSNNHLNAFTGAPKHHLADPALAARLVRVSASQLLTGAGPSAAIPRDGTFLGGLFESLAALSIRTFAQRCDARVSHLRTKGGRHEVDLVVEADGGVVAFEVKLSASINDPHVSHLRWLRGELGDNCIDVVVLNTGAITSIHIGRACASPR